MFLRKPQKPSPLSDYYVKEVFCCECCDDQLHQRVWVSRTIQFSKENLELTVPFEALQCLHCGACRFSEEINKRNFDRVYEALLAKRTEQALDDFLSQNTAKTESEISTSVRENKTTNE